MESRGNEAVSQSVSQPPGEKKVDRCLSVARHSNAGRPCPMWHVGFRLPQVAMGVDALPR